MAGWYAAFLENISLPNAGVFTFLVAWGELLVGIGLILGAATISALLAGAFMHLNTLCQRVQLALTRCFIQRQSFFYSQAHTTMVQTDMQSLISKNISVIVKVKQRKNSLTRQQLTKRQRTTGVILKQGEKSISLFLFYLFLCLFLARSSAALERACASISS